ncbi:MAG TPA: tetratricopeptide repeat protein [Terriglobia bacterium]|nr:tetratricopeptide repeat protein [Terriglobia bacterium]
MEKKLPFSWFVFVALLCASLPCLTAAPQSVAPAENVLLKQGIQLLSEGKYDQAISTLSKCKQESPRDPRPYFYAGMALTQADKLPPAAMELKEAVRLAPKDPLYRIFQANVYCRLRQKTPARDALSMFKDTDSLRHIPSSWLYMLSDVYLSLIQSDQSLEVLKILQERDPDDPRTNYELGKVYSYSNQLDQTIHYCRKSIQESPVNPDAYFELGKAYYQKGDLPSARQAFLQAVRQDKENPEFLLKLGDTCLAMRESAEAIKYLKLAEPLAGSFPRIYYVLGRAYQRQGDRANGDAYMKKFQEISAAQSASKERTISVDRLIIRGQVELDAGKTEEARSLFEQVAKIDPHRWEAQGYLAEMCLESGDLQRAYSHLVWMQKIYPESVVSNYLMARYWVLKKNYNQALAFALKAKTTMPDNTELRNLLATIYSHLGEKDKAEQESKEANALAPDSARARQDIEQLRTPKSEPNLTPPQ